MLFHRRVMLLATVVAIGAGLAACGSSDDSASGLSPDAKAGKSIAQTRCSGCHTTDGSRRTGPTFKGLAGSTVTLENGTTVTADHAYLVESTLDPEAKVVKGYPNIMGSAVPKGSMTAQQAEQIAVYLETLR